MQLEINPQEQRTLERILQRYLSELRNEIDHTDSREYRDGLKHEAEMLAALRAKLESREEAVKGMS